MTISPEFLDEIRARVSVSSVAGRRVKLVRAGREMKGCCPFHNEKTPSFYVNDDKAFYHCFGCGAHGDVIRFTVEQEGLGFRDAVESLATQAGLEMPAESPDSQERSRAASGLHEVTARAASWFAEQLAGTAGVTAWGYLEKRGLTPATVAMFGLGLAPDTRTKLKTALDSLGEANLVEAGLLVTPDEGDTYDRFRGRLMFPIRDPRGRVIAFGGRLLGEGEPKYLNSPDTPLFDKGRTLYNLDRAGPLARKSRRLIVVEGYMDVIALAQAGFDEAIAPLGTALTEAQLGMMWRIVPEPVLCFDGDAAGRRAALRAAERALPLLLPGQSLSIATLPSGQDPDDLIRDGGSEAFAAVVNAATPLYEFIWQSVVGVADTSTPERRALVHKTLRDYAATIGDAAVRNQYDLIFRERYWAAFGRQTSGSNVINVTFQSRRSLQALKIPVHYHETVAIVVGLLNYPKVASDLIELVGRLPLPKPQLVTLCQAIVDAVAWSPEISRDNLADMLRNQGFATTVADVRQTNRLGFSYTNPRRNDEHAARDLAFCVTVMIELSDLSRELGRVSVAAAASHRHGPTTSELAELHAGYERDKARLHGEVLQVREKIYQYLEDHRGEPVQQGYYVTTQRDDDANGLKKPVPRIAA